MIDCNSLPINLQGQGDTTPPSSEAAAAADDHGINFSKLVEEREEHTVDCDEPQESLRDENLEIEGQENFQWITYFLHLTREAQGSEQDNTLDAQLLKSDTNASNGSARLQILIDAASERAQGEDSSHLSSRGKGALMGKDLTLESDDGENHFSIKGEKSEKNFRSIAVGEKTLTQQPIDSKPISLGSHTNPLVTESHLTQNSSLKDHDFSQTLIPIRPLHSDQMDKMAVKMTPDMSSMSRATSIEALDGIELIRSRKQGDMTWLQLQLKPENLGAIEAKVRLDENHLLVELTADKPQTARILEKDQSLLMQVLEKLAFLVKHA